METEHPTPAEIVASIYHLLRRILLLLPIKSLTRFKSVSKEWLSLISDPAFCHLRNPNPNPAIGLFFPSDEPHRWLSLPFRANGSIPPPFRSSEFTRDSLGFRIIQSCNGLLLCITTPRYHKNPMYCVYNPTTNCFSELPKPNERVVFLNAVCWMSLAFDPAMSRHYNVVCLSILSAGVNSGNKVFQIRLYSSETGSWQLCGEPFEALVNFDSGVYWNRAVHWLGYGKGDSFYFNIDHQVLDKMPKRPGRQGWNNRTDYHFGESCGHLHLTEMTGPSIGFNVYEMRRDYSEWFIVHKVNLSSIVYSNPEMVVGRAYEFGLCNLVFSVLAIIRGEREEDSFLVIQLPGKAIRYNLVSKTSENLPVLEDADMIEQCLRYPGIHQGFQYIESLCCV
ncbi:hypothetical protein ABFX02_06G051500 [Erythranthe guttata]